MADFEGQQVVGISDQAGASSGRMLVAGGSFTLPVPPTLVSMRDDLLNNPVFGGELDPQTPTGAFSLDWKGQVIEAPQFYWFERVWSKPQRIELGNLLTTITREIEIYNAYREAERTFTSATNNAGPGIIFIGLPSLPTQISPQVGEIFDVQISTDGPPVIDGTLDFDMDTPDISIPITGNRVVMFPYVPESPLTERLEFKTGIMMATDGSETRQSIRKHPRQIFETVYRLGEDEERRKMQALLFTWHPRVFGVPVWFEARMLDTDAAILDTTVYVDTTYADFRVGGLAIVWSDFDRFDALEVDSLTDTSITFSSPVTFDFVAGQTLVMPLRVGITDRTIDVTRALNNAEDVTLQFTIEDNETDFASTAAFNTHNSKVMLDDPNFVNGSSIKDSIDQQVDRLDNLSGKPIQFSDWPTGQYNTTKGFVKVTRQGLWEVRQLVHALRGSQVSFYLPTFYRDIVVTDNLASGSFLMDIEHIGYTDFVDGAEPNKSLWIELNDGTILTRQVNSSVVIDSITERLTVDVQWALTIAPADINRVSFLRLSRITNDEVTLIHDHAGNAQIGFRVRGVRQ